MRRNARKNVLHYKEGHGKIIAHTVYAAHIHKHTPEHALHRRRFGFRVKCQLFQVLFGGKTFHLKEAAQFYAYGVEWVGGPLSAPRNAP